MDPPSIFALSDQISVSVSIPLSIISGSVAEMYKKVKKAAITARIGVRKSSFLRKKIGRKTTLTNKRYTEPYAANADTATGMAI